MARSRNLKPGFFANETLAEIEPLGRILFQGLWCHADREGRLEDRPKRLKVQVLPFDDCDVDALLSELDKRGFIRRYKADGGDYIQVVNFSKHQHPHIHENTSTIPAPDKHRTRTRQAPDKHSSSPSLTLLPITSTTEAPDKHRASGFGSFWEAYPKKKAPARAEAAWKKISPSPELLKTILDAVKKQSASRDWLKDGGQFIPNPATWLNGREWDNEISANGNGAASPPSIDEIERRRETQTAVVAI